MNWKEIDDFWKQYAEETNGVLKIDEQPHSFGKTTEYHYSTDFNGGQLIIEGKIRKSTKGYNTYRTIAFFKSDKINFAELNISRRKGLGKLFGKYSGIDYLGNNTKELIEKSEVEKITGTQKGFKVEYDYMFSESAEFISNKELCTLLLDEVKNRLYHNR
ncbi:hypothetical protein K6119_09785 [Paracrocinitomix mangrovi]|uniref:hypothetical protein n=1 Tax=Paracrocinitomix mangrovi TaxID=2862509 RepID=UPI001C8D37CF|nr:hypothetical protein [Paracrocinitomix mangrovi]UKN03780.1 hypothetical protein K6119_09785 [Paracrocinitomix mangrovi]